MNGKCDFNPLKVNDPYCDCGIGYNGTACEITVCDTNKGFVSHNSILCN